MNVIKLTIFYVGSKGNKKVSLSFNFFSFFIGNDPTFFICYLREIANR